MDHPPSDPAKLLAAWADGEKGETPPGRTLSNLKTGGLREILEHLVAVEAEAPGDDRPAVDPAGLLAAWMEWEKGQTPPGAVAAALATGGLRGLLEDLVRAAGAVAPGPGAG